MARGFLFLSANTPWVYALAKSLADTAPVTALQVYDFPNYHRVAPCWPEEESVVRRRRVVMPPGYAGRLEPFFRPLMRSIVAEEHARLASVGGEDPFVIAPYPHLAPWVRGIPGEDLIYYNLDNYDLYRPDRTDWIHLREDELLERARLTVCLSVYQVERLAARKPAFSYKIRHFPLGVVDDFLNPDPGAPPLQGTVGYVGNLGDRVDWTLVEAIATRMPETTFHFVGFVSEPADPLMMTEWQRVRAGALNLPNVIHEGGVPQADVAAHYWRYAVNWMPYDMAHPFNLAACPTKIMDAIASGRPFVSTPTPEVALYPDLIATAADADGLVAALRRALVTPVDSAARVEFARSHRWTERARQLRGMLGLCDGQ